MSLLIDPNRRIDCLLQYCKELPSQRIADTVLPLLSLNSKTAICSSIGIGIYQGTIQISQVVTAIKNSKWREGAIASFPLVFTVSSIAFSILAPAVHSIVSNGICLTYRVGLLSVLLWRGEWEKSGYLALQIAHQSIHIASLYYGTMAWIVFSLVSQAISEIYQAIEFASVQRKPEALAHIVLAMIRLNAARSKIFDGRQLTQAEWDDIFSQIRSNREYRSENQDVKTILTSRGISLYVQDIDFAKKYGSRNNKTPDLSNLNFKDLHFQRCNFSGVRFEKSQFQNITANYCNFSNAFWRKCEFDRSIFYK